MTPAAKPVRQGLAAPRCLGRIAGGHVRVYLPGYPGLPMRETVAPRVMSRPLLLAGAAFILALAGTLWLWAYYGATVFFETIRAGFIACFG